MNPDDLKAFINIINQRSNENEQAIEKLYERGLYGQAISVLRQELDSMVRVIFLLHQSLDERENLIKQTLENKRWKLRGGKQVTDRELVDLADKLNGWTKSVYKFGCAFIHLSSFHDYNTNDPFKSLSKEEINSIKEHLHSSHFFPLSFDLTMETLSDYLPRVFEKIHSNLECYVKDLETNQIQSN